MTTQDILDIIEKYSLCIRKLPKETIEIFNIRHFKEGDTIIKRNNIEYCQRTRKRERQGYLVKQVNNHDAIINFNKCNNVFYGDTLEISIDNFLKSLGQNI